MGIIGLIIAGAIMGSLARLLLKGDQNMGTLITVALGILGVLAGYYVSGALGVSHTRGVDWIRWGISLLCSAGFISAYVTLRARNTGPRA